MTLSQYLNSQFSLAQNLDFCFRLLLACACGASIGAERSRRFKEAGRSPVFRTVMIALGLWFVTRLVTVIGIYSVLFGRRGLISGYVKKKMEERNKEDDD